VTNADILNYFMLTTSFCTGERFKVYKSMDSYKYFVSGFCEGVKGRLIGDHFVVVGKASQYSSYSVHIASTKYNCCYEV